MTRAASGPAGGQRLAGGAGMLAGEVRKWLEAAGSEKAPMVLLTNCPAPGGVCMYRIVVQIFVYAT